jgi:hypothetical protein
MKSWHWGVIFLVVAAYFVGAMWPNAAMWAKSKVGM